MQTKLAEFVKNRDEHEELQDILRSCVHCGFCNATCPTYQLTGDELDGPRGRIYLLKEMLEGNSVGSITQNHIDRCLSCRSCETTCPSGVKYERLLDLGRLIIEEKVKRPFLQQLTRLGIGLIFSHQQRFAGLMWVARGIKPLIPKKLGDKIPEKQQIKAWPQKNHAKKILLLSGCVQPVLRPSIDRAAARVLDKFKFSLQPVEAAGCCGALNYHLSEHEKAKQMARNNIDACWPLIEQGVEAILMTASGCGLSLKEYGEILKYDPQYADKSQVFSAKVKDLCEIVQHQDLSIFNAGNTRIAYQSPCTLQHGQKLAGVVESLLTRTGFDLVAVENAHICCGSAGVYSLLQAEMSEQLRQNKLESLQQVKVDCIATANIGCLSHLQSGSPVKVVHWIELLDEMIIA